MFNGRRPFSTPLNFFFHPPPTLPIRRFNYLSTIKRSYNNAETRHLTHGNLLLIASKRQNHYELTPHAQHGVHQPLNHLRYKHIQQ